MSVNIKDWGGWCVCLWIFSTPTQDLKKHREIDFQVANGD